MRELRRTMARFRVIGRKAMRKLFPQPTPGDAIPTPDRSAAATSLEGKVVVITGATGGIGRTLATGFCSAGACVVLNGRDRGRLDDTLRSLGLPESRCIGVVADVSTAQGAHTLFSESLERFGHVDILVNNAAISGPKSSKIWELTQDDWETLLRTNLLSAAYCTTELLEHARTAQRLVRAVQVSSGIVGHAAQGLGGYGVTKDALEALGRAFAADDPAGLLSCVSLRPRSVRTAMTREYYDSTEFALLDDPETLMPAFLWAATAPAALVDGRAFHDQVVAANPLAAERVHGAMAAAAPIRIEPETFRVPGLADSAGAYMHLLENAQGFYPSARAALVDGLDARALYAYPDPGYRALKEAISEEAGVPPSRIALGPGSSELLDRMLRLFCVPGDHVVMTKPTWSFFHSFIQRWQVIPTEVPMTGNLARGISHDLQGLLAAITSRTRLLYLVNPCNPTGSMLDPDELLTFIRKVPEQVCIVVDEAYIQYARPDMRPALAAEIGRCAARLIVLRTFSKFFGLSGFRLGFAIADEEVVELLSRAEIPFAISAPACRVVPAVLADAAFRSRVYEMNAEGRQVLRTGLAQLKINSQESHTNFLLFDCPTDPDRLHARLREHGLILPRVDQFPLRNYALLAVGRPEHNRKVLEILAEY